MRKLDCIFVLAKISPMSKKISAGKSACCMANKEPGPWGSVQTLYDLLLFQYRGGGGRGGEANFGELWQTLFWQTPKRRAFFAKVCQKFMTF